MTETERQAFDDIRDTRQLALSDGVPTPTILLMLRARAGSMFRQSVAELFADAERGPILNADLDFMVTDPDPAVARATRELRAALAVES
jgi:hypothetical protein